MQGETMATYDSNEEAKAVAQRFRFALEQGSLTYDQLSGFPGGTCGLVSRMLGEYMCDQGLGLWYYRSGVRNPGDDDREATHAWIEKDGVIADITADQDRFGREPVIVTRDSTWYEQFRREDYGPVVARLDPEDDPLRADYETLKSRADNLRNPSSADDR